MKRAALLAVATALSLQAGVASGQEPDPRPASNAPNVVVVMTDDQRADDMSPIPKTRR